jgi:cell division protein FtsB
MQRGNDRSGANGREHDAVFPQPQSSAGADLRKHNFEGRNKMLWTILVILVILWLLGFALKIGGGLIHLVLVIAVILLIVQLITGRRV